MRIARAFAVCLGSCASLIVTPPIVVVRALDLFAVLPETLGVDFLAMIQGYRTHRATSSSPSPAPPQPSIGCRRSAWGLSGVALVFRRALASLEHREAQRVGEQDGIGLPKGPNEGIALLHQDRSMSAYRHPNMRSL